MATNLTTQAPKTSKHLIKNDRNLSILAFFHKYPLEERIHHMHSSSTLYYYKTIPRTNKSHS